MSRWPVGISGRDWRSSDRDPGRRSAVVKIYFGFLQNRPVMIVFFGQHMDRPEATVATSLAHENTRESFAGYGIALEVWLRFVLKQML